MSLQTPRRYEVHLWSWCLDDDRLCGEAGEALLNEAERARSSRFMTALLRQRFTAARARLRSLLGTHLGRDPGSLVFVENEFGKPRLVTSSSHFVASRIMAVGSTPPLGPGSSG